MWDVDTVTAADFTVETVFTERMWETFLNKEDVVNAPNESRIKMFEELLRKEVEAIVSTEASVLKEESEIRVSHITFAFNNVPVIKLLQQRGACITTA